MYLQRRAFVIRLVILTGWPQSYCMSICPSKQTICDFLEQCHWTAVIRHVWKV